MAVHIRSLSKFLFPLFLLFLSITVFAQGTTGSVEGKVADATGAPIAGATVTIENQKAAAGFKKTVTTNENGEFTINEIPPGDFTISASSPNFRSFRGDIGISTDKITLAPITLDVGMTDSVVVIEPFDNSAEATPEIRTSNRRETLEKMPRRPTFGSLLKLAPHVRPEVLAGGFQIDGNSGADNTFFIDGQEVTNFKTGLLNSNNDLPFELLQEVQVRSAAIPAEYGGATGGVVNVVSQGGNNHWRGNFGVSFAPGQFRGDPNAVLNRFGTGAGQIEYFEPQTDDGTDLFPTASLGGPVIKDKFWFFASYSPQIYKTTRAIDYFSGLNPATRTVRETIRYESNVRTEESFLRFDAQPVESVRAFASFLYNPIIQDGALPAFTEGFAGAPQTAGGLRGADFLATRGGRLNSNIVNGQVSWDATRNLLLNFRAGRGFLNEKLGSYGVPRTTRFLCSTSGTPQSVPGSGCAPGFQNIADNFARDYEVSRRTTFDAEGALSGIGFFGRHNFKFGYQYNHLFNDIREGYTDTGIVNLFYGIPISSLIGIIPTPGNLGSGFLQRFGTVGSDSNTNHALYAQDSWRIRERLTLNLGVRFENEDIPDYDGVSFTEVPTLNEERFDGRFGWTEKIAPRLGFAYDVFGDGKSKVFGSYGWFYDRFKYNASQQQFPVIFYRDYFEILPSRGAFYGNYTFGNILGNNVDNPNSNCPGNNAPIGSGWSVCQISFRIPTNIGIEFFGLPPFAPDLKPARSSELTIGAEHKFGYGLTLAGRYIDRRLDRAIEDITNFNDQGSEFSTIGNPGSDLICEIVTGADLPCAKAERKYRAIEVIADYRKADHFFNVSYTYSRLFGNYSGLASSDEGGLVMPNSSWYFELPASGFDADGNPDNGRLATDRPHVFKAYGGYAFKWFGSNANRTSVSAFTTIQSGTPLTTVFSLYNVPTTILNGRGDLGRTEIYSETDLMVGHRYRFGRDDRFTLEPYVVFLNLFDERNELRRQTTISATNFTAAALTQGGCPTCTSEYAVYQTIFNGSGIRQAVQNYLNARGVGSTGVRNDYNLPILFQAPRDVRLGVRFMF